MKNLRILVFLAVLGFTSLPAATFNYAFLLGLGGNFGIGSFDYSGRSTNNTARFSFTDTSMSYSGIVNLEYRAWIERGRTGFVMAPFIGVSQSFLNTLQHEIDGNWTDNATNNGVPRTASGNMLKATITQTENTSVNFGMLFGYDFGPTKLYAGASFVGGLYYGKYRLSKVDEKYAPTLSDGTPDTYDYIDALSSKNLGFVSGAGINLGAQFEFTDRFGISLDATFNPMFLKVNTRYVKTIYPNLMGAADRGSSGIHRTSNDNMLVIYNVKLVMNLVFMF